MINAAGIGSGLDVNSIISQLMQVERQPLAGLQKKESQLQSQISAYGKLRSAMDSFKTAMDKLSSTEKFELYSAASSNETVAKATAGATASTGSYSVVVNNLAQNHKMTSAQTTATTQYGGVSVWDSIDFTVGSNSFSVDLYNNGTPMTLAQIRDAINAHPDNASVSATIITGNNGAQQLVLNARQSGYDGRIQLGYGGVMTPGTLGFADANVDSNGVPLTSLQQLDASFVVDGMSVNRASNSISDVISGVTFDLKSVGSSTINVERDNTAVSDTIRSMVDSYNELNKVIKDLRAGELKGDTTLNSIVSQMRTELNTPTATGMFKTLGEVGLLTSRFDGTLEINSATLNNALSTDFSGVAALFGNDKDGMALRLKNLAAGMLSLGDGLLSSRTEGLNSRIKENQKHQDRLEYRLETVEKGYRRQFTALDTLMSQMNATSSALQNQLAALVMK